ncbi:hypothetical protein [Frigidibacter oleivorans]|uniref:hypothetical protein n=1 Tax=Frigidibacter oleivorans TaxID=2487129 RepID=UPI000F8EF309|nr:hypothetical protein [Frigidibacter oleivorans]
MLRAASLLAVALLAGCVETQSAGTVAAAQVGPGSSLLDPEDQIFAAMLFNDVCGDTGAKPAAAKAVLAKLPVTQHPETGTYYHQNLDLSFKLVKEGSHDVCSMVFGSRSELSSIGLMLAAGSAAKGAPVGMDPDTGEIEAKAAKGGTLYFAPINQQNGRKYYRAWITN